MKKRAKNFTTTELRRIIRLRNKELSLSEIAKLMGTSAQTIKNLLEEFYVSGEK